jgi:hypothetical protein
MQIKNVAVYKFGELSDPAKGKAVAYFRDRFEYPWYDEAMGSIRAFVRALHGDVTDWSIGGEVYRSFVKTTLDESFFTDLELSDFVRDHMPTGYCLDATLWVVFYDEFKKTGDGFHAYEQAIESALSEINSDVEYHYSDESVIENIEINEYEFEADGSPFFSRVRESATA